MEQNWYDTWFAAVSLLKDQTWKQSDNFLNGPVSQDVVENQLGDEELVAAHLTGHVALDLNSLLVVKVVQLLQHLQQKHMRPCTVTIQIVDSSEYWKSDQST